MRILIVEPHGDDAFISCSSALMREDFEIDVLTFSDRDSNALKSHYKSVRNTIFLDAPDVHYDLRIKYSTHDIHKRYLAGEDLYNYYLEDMQDLLTPHPTSARETFSAPSVAYGSFLGEVLSKSASIPSGSSYDLILLPVGLFHPNHYATRRVARSYLFKDDPIVYYVDKPYIEKRYVQEILKCSTYDLYTAPVQDRATRASLFKELYPTEQGLLRFSSATILEWKDIYAVGMNYENNPVVLEFLSKVSDMKEGDKYENLSLMNIGV